MTRFFFIITWFLVLAGCTEQEAVELDESEYCANMCNFAERCQDADAAMCQSNCTDRFVVEGCAKRNFLASPLLLYSDCVSELQCSETEQTCMRPLLEKDPLAQQCEEWMDGCPGDVDRNACRLTPFATDEFRIEFRNCIRRSCDSPEIYEYCATLHLQCFQ